MGRVTRRQFIRVAATGAAAVHCSRPSTTRAQGTVKIGTAVLGDYSLAGPIIVALEKGFFRAEQLDVEFVPFRGGPNLVKAVIAGDVLIGAAGSTDILVFREAGMPLKMIATQTDGNHFTLNVAPEILKVADLKGKAIGVTLIGSTTWVFARVIAKQQGWDPDRDVKIVGLGGLDAQVAALARKEIHAFVFGDSGAVTELQGKSRVLARLDAVTPRWISQIQYASEDSIKKHREAIRKSLHAIFRAQRFMRANPREATGIAAKTLGWSPEATLGAHKISGALMSEDGRINVDALRTMQDTLIEFGVLKKRLPLDEHYTTEFTPVPA